MPAGYTPTRTTNPSPTRSGGGSWIPGAVGGLFSSWINARQQKKEREHRTQTEADRRRYDLEQWHRANRYNHPLEQMQRLRDAGLNPNMIYGSSPGSAVGNAGQIPTAQAPDMDYTNWAQPGIDTYQNVRVQQAQTNNLRAQANLNNVSAMEGIEKTGLTRAEKINKQNLLAGNLEMQQVQIKEQHEKAYQAVLQTKAMSNKDKGVIARYAAETQTAFELRDTAKFKKELDKLNAKLASKGIRPNDSVWLRIMSLITGMDLSRPMTKQEQDNLKTIIKNPK